MEYIKNLEQNTCRNIDGKGHSGEVSDGNEEHVIGQWKKDDPCYKVAKRKQWLCSSVLWNL